MGHLDGYRGLIVGIANNRSIAYGIAQAAAAAGAQLALTYQSERLEPRVRQAGQELGAAWIGPCDLNHDDQVEALGGQLRGLWDRLDFVIHAVAHAQREDLEGRFVDTSREGFRQALETSVYSLLPLVRAVEPLLSASGRGAVLTMSYLGAQRVVPHYNVMGVAKAGLEAAVRYLASDLGPQGIRVNALSPGPIKTLSASGVKGLRTMLSHVESTAPLRRNVSIDDVGQTAAFLVSDLARGIAGEVVHVDCGYHILGAAGLGV